MAKMMPLKRDYDFSFVGLLVSEEKATGPGGSHSVDELYNLAKQLFDAAMRHGFKPEQIFFDSTVFPLARKPPAKAGRAATVKSIRTAQLVVRIAFPFHFLVALIFLPPGVFLPPRGSLCVAFFKEQLPCQQENIYYK